MEFLKEILGDELYAQFETAVNAYNGNEANKEKPIKIGNLGGGEYVGKGKYDALQALLDGKSTELDTANGLIAELKKGTKDDEALQGKIATYEGQIQTLQQQLQDTKIKSAIKVALLSEKAIDVDYLSYKLETKLKEENKKIQLDDNDNIKGWSDMLSGLKTQFPTQFETAGKKTVVPNKLPEGEPNGGAVSKEAFEKMGVEERSKFKAENEQLYKTYTGKD